MLGVARSKVVAIGLHENDTDLLSSFAIGRNDFIYCIVATAQHDVSRVRHV